MSFTRERKQPKTHPPAVATAAWSPNTSSTPSFSTAKGYDMSPNTGPEPSPLFLSPNTLPLSSPGSAHSRQNSGSTISFSLMPYVEPSVSMHVAASASEEEAQTDEAGWTVEPYLSLYEPLYNKGIVAVRDGANNAYPHITPSTFTYGVNTFTYGTEEEILKKHPRGRDVFAKTHSLLEPLQAIADSYQSRIIVEALAPYLTSDFISPLFNPESTTQPAASPPNKQKKPSSHSTTSILGTLKEKPRVEEEVKVVKPAQTLPCPTSRRSQKKQKYLQRDHLLNIIQEYAAENQTDNVADLKNRTAVYRQTSYDPIAFLPLIIKNLAAENIAIQIHPWLSGGKVDGKLPPAKRYVTACCMFGNAMTGISSKGWRINLIKHDIEFHPEQIIHDIHVAKESFYEDTEFAAFQRIIAPMINKTSDARGAEIWLHLPATDYILFAVRLYLQGNMNLKVLEKFCIATLRRKDELGKHFNALFSDQPNMKPVIVSPFDNLFNLQEKDPAISISAFILGKLGLPSNIPHYQNLTREDANQKQADVVQRCLTLLATNNYSPMQAELWQEFQEKWRTLYPKNIDTLEELFRVGNALVVAHASHVNYKLEPYEVCCVQTLSEMQIQKEHKKFSKNSTLCKPVLNLTHLTEPMAYDVKDVPDAKNREGNLFYFETNENGAKLGLFIEQAAKNGARTRKESQQTASTEIHGLSLRNGRSS